MLDQMRNLYEAGNPIPDKIREKNKYTFFANLNHIDHYRVISSGQLLISGLLREGAIPGYVKAFIKEHNEVIMIANFVGETITYIIIRAMRQKRFIHFGYSKGLFYGICDCNGNHMHSGYHRYSKNRYSGGKINEATNMGR